MKGLSVHACYLVRSTHIKLACRSSCYHSYIYLF